MKRLFMALLAAIVLIGFSYHGDASAQSSSSNYSVQESSFSSGSGSGASSSYSAQISAGDNAVGSSYSANYGAYTGPINPNEEYLEMVVTAATINLDTPTGDPGDLSATETATGSGSFYVRAYLNSTYIVTTLSSTLTSEGGATITPMAATAAAVTGTEQFGINLVDNASPNIGADPSLQPNGSFANGTAATGYGTPDQFKYAQGDTIAQSTGTPAWGQTNFTISYIANISTITEAGFYQMQHELVVLSTY
jgi:hypothetical protein